MGKAKVRLSAFDPTISTDTKRTGIASDGSVGSRTWDNAASAGQPQHKGLGNNAKLAEWATSLNFDGTNDYLELSTAESISTVDWMFVIAFVDLDTSSDNTLLGFEGVGVQAGNDGYLQIGSGGTSIKWNGCTGKLGEQTIATNTTNSSTISYTFGSDVEVLILYQTSSVQYYYNIDGDLIGQSPLHGAYSQACDFTAIGYHSGATELLNAQVLDVRIYTGSDVPPNSAASLQAIGNRYKQMMD